MAEVTSFATRSCSSYNMRVRRLPGRKFGLVHGHVVPIPTPDGKVTAISFSGHDPECCEEAKDALTLPAGSAVGRLLHVPRATLHGEVHNTPCEAACILVRRKES
jgi:LuxR family transcriptional regulator, quorum-sensing system regulator BjaR1